MNCANIQWPAGESNGNFYSVEEENEEVDDSYKSGTGELDVQAFIYIYIYIYIPDQ